MAAACSGGGAAFCSGRDDHIRTVALTVAVKKVEAESDLFTFRRPDYSAEVWRFLYVTTGTDYYLNSIRLVGFCGVNGMNWAVVTRMKEISNPSCENFHAILPEECCPILHYMRPQFRFLIYLGRDDKRVNLDERESVLFFEDAEKVVSGDASVWGGLLWWTGFIFFLMLNAWFLPGCGRSSLRGRPIRACLRVSTMCIRECVVLFCCHHTISVSTLLYICIACLFSFYCVCGCV